ncbi:HAMP domain-containing sensor histidine kinase [Nodularia harveyana UHCC-0300]|uniref:histidine kinase n=1 Tax=Nodularia harveyana UHCC-0300 TaxID=2974287 RepID=A0ABU5UEV2_9CYAN|nr:HAMP domain-containing sensor histidine kinase [Nodularia harveyana]MEA5582034.1 HAMP domain-containing sensor histidine kinase [Nodularia harveyana UHCC-0300]
MRKLILPGQWAILANPQFRATGGRLLLSYLVAMMVVMGLSSVVVYNFCAYSFSKQLDRQLLTLADAASHSLTAIEGDKTAIYRKMPRVLDDDGDLDIPWQDLRIYHQSVEWFNPQQQLLGKAGKQFPQIPLVNNFHSWQQNGMRTLTIPVYASGKNQELLGYVRVSTSTVEVKEELDRLLTGLGFGGIFGLVLIAVTGSWLTGKSLQPIEQSFQQLQQFTADASHELRSPLTAIKTTVEVLQSHPERIHPHDVKKIEIIHSATAQMTCLVEDLLLLARSGGASTSLEKTAIPIPVDEILFDVVESLRSVAQSQQVTLEADVIDGVWIKGDAHQLQRLFGNLLENALQYTPNQGLINVSMVRRDNFVVIEVVDTGIGIAPEYLPLVFNRFWRGDKARSRRQGGSGLGLAIVQSITHAHGGEVSVTSKLGRGSCFLVKLPVI